MKQFGWALLVLAAMLTISPATPAVAATGAPGSLETMNALLTEFEQAIQSTHAEALRQYDQAVVAQNPGAAAPHRGSCQMLSDYTHELAEARGLGQDVEELRDKPWTFPIYRNTLEGWGLGYTSLARSEHDEPTVIALKSIRPRIHAATTYTQLAELLIEMEGQLPRDWFPPAWAGRRSGWTAEVRAAFGGTVLTAARPAVSPAPVVSQASAGDAVTRLAKLLKEWEAATKYEAQASDWSTRRDAWITQVDHATTLDQLKSALLTFVTSITDKAMGEAWLDDRGWWLSEINRATTPSQLGNCMNFIEVMFKVEFQEDSWENRSDGWRDAVDAAAGAASPAAVTAQAPTAPAPATGGSVPKLAALLLEFELATTFNATTTDWQSHRVAWVGTATTANSPAQLKELLTTFEAAVNLAAQSSDWAARRDGWIAEVKNASTIAQLATLTREFEASVKWESMVASWKNRRDGWVSEVNAAGTGGAASSVPPATVRPGPAAVPTQPASAPVPTPMALLARLLTTSENTISSTDQQANWGSLRDAWTDRVNHATTVPALGPLLLELEASMLPGSMVSSWPARRSAWVSEVKSTTEVTKMNGLINEFDSAVSNSSRFDNDDWY